MATKSNGPDCKRGPDCCCDPCYLARNFCTSVRCCRCVPRTMCLKFTPDDPNICNEVSYLGDWEGEGTHRYTLSIDIYTIYMSLEWDGYADQENCFWRIQVVAQYSLNDIQILSTTDYPIVYQHVSCDDPGGTDTYGFQTCQNPIFTFTDLLPFYNCPGTFTLSRFEMERVPFRKNVFSPPVSEVPLYPSRCANCDTVCQHICVRYLIDDDLIEKDFTWDGDKWINVWANGVDFITLEDDLSGYDRCKLGFSIADLANHGITFLNTTIDTPCGVGLIFETTEGGNYIAVSCNPCACWRRICGNCRCVCKTLCVAHSDGSVNGTVYEELHWDDALGGWGDYDYFIGLEDDGNGGCQLVVPGYPYPFPVDGCGRSIAVFVEQNDTGAFLSIGCKACTCGRPVGCCGNKPIPAILYADVTSRPYDAYDTAHVHPCFNALAVPLFYVPQGVQEDIRWVGYFEVDNGCGIARFRIDLVCTGGGTGPDGEGTGGFSAEVFSVSSPSAGNVLFPTIQVTDCDPLMIGDDTWGVLGGAGLSGIGGPDTPPCIECSYGVSLRITE